VTTNGFIHEYRMNLEAVKSLSSVAHVLKELQDEEEIEDRLQVIREVNQQREADITQTVGRPYADPTQTIPREEVNPLESRVADARTTGINRDESGLIKNNHDHKLLAATPVATRYPTGSERLPHHKLVATQNSSLNSSGNSSENIVRETPAQNHFTQKRIDQDQKPQGRPLATPVTDYFPDGWPYPNDWHSLSAREKRQLIAKHRIARNQQTPSSAPPPNLVDDDAFGEMLDMRYISAGSKRRDWDD
jgi:hypothetical protein